MKIREVISFFERIAPSSFQESYDNSGLQLGDPEADVSGALLCIDVTEEVVEEAVSLNIRLIISHHPVIFTGLKSLSNRSFTERIIIKAIKNDIAIISLHTNLDNSYRGVSWKMAEKLRLINLQVLRSMKDALVKLVFFVPSSHLEKVRQSIFNAGAGVIGEYDMCSFNVEGKGTFRGSENTNPYTGTKGEFHTENEIRVETILPSFLQEKILDALVEVHPYEEVAYDFYPLKNEFRRAGAGITGDLEQTMDEKEFLVLVKNIFKCGCIRHSDFTGRKISKVAVCGGSGSFLLNDAISSGADAFISGDFKYHQFFEPDRRILLADIGHYESEQFTKELFYESLTKNFPKFAVHLSKINTNPINYL